MTNTVHRIGGEYISALTMSPFIDRQEDMVAIVQLLTNSSCRLLTLIGPGGIGKTRLAWELATRFDEFTGLCAAASHATGGPMGPQTPYDFADGIFFINLVAVQTMDHFAPALAGVLGCTLNSPAPALEQLCNYLSDKKLLLILDNFEHLLSPAHSAEDSPEDSITEAQAPGWLAVILHAAPDVKLLVTSREALHLQEEWLYPISGLPVPPVTQSAMAEEFPEDGKRERADQDFTAYAAVHLFIECARRVNPAFDVTREMAGVVRVCQLVEGMPLALELAATWTQSLDTMAIADEIQRNLNFLATYLRNVPERHRSIQAVFVQTWSMLSEEERRVFRRLAVFRGGFRRNAAEQVAGATLPVLSALVSKSLLRWEANGRYQIHELLRQCAEEQLNAEAAEGREVSRRHCAYFADFLHQRIDTVSGPHQLEVLAEIASELENIRSAWAYAIQHSNVDALRKVVYAYAILCDVQGRYQELAEALEQAIQHLRLLEPSPRVAEALAAMVTNLGWNCIRLGRLQEAEALFAEGQDLLKTLGLAPPAVFSGDPALGLGLLAQIRGDYEQAHRLAAAASQRCEQQGDQCNLQLGLFILANAAFAQGDYETAWRHAQRAYLLSKTQGNRWMMAYILGDLGNVARALGKYDQARQYFQTCYTIKKEFNDPEGMAMALNNLAKIARLQQDHAEAVRLSHRSLALYQRINDRGGLATSYYELGENALAQGDLAAAQQHLLAGLQIATEMLWRPRMLLFLTAIAELLRQWGQPSAAVELLSLSAAHPAGNQETKEIAKARLKSLAGEMAPDRFRSAVEAGKTQELDIVCETLLVTLATTVQAIHAAHADAWQDAAELHQPLVEPLTNRELEVLQLIGTGLTNQQIADELVLSVGTVKFYTGQIYGKLGVSNRTQAIVRARELALLQ